MDSHSQGEQNPSEIQMMLLLSDVFQSLFHWSNLASSDLVDVQHMCYVKTYLHLNIAVYIMFICLFVSNVYVLLFCCFILFVLLFFVLMSTYFMYMCM